MSVKKIIAIILVSAIAVFLVIFKFISCNQQEAAKSVSVAPSAIPVDVIIAGDTVVPEKIHTIGTLFANEQVEIVSEISKKVTGIYMKEGGFVKKGDLLFKLDDSDILAEINTLKVEEELAASNEKRQRALLNKGGISQEMYDEVSNRLNTILAEIKVLETEFDKTEIRAPFDGRLGLRQVSEGAWVTPASRLTDLHDLHKLKVIFTVPERYADEIRKGEKVSIAAEGSSEKFTATIDAFEPAVDINTRTLKVQAILDNSRAGLVPGTSVDVDVDLESQGGSLFVPTSALIPSPEGYYVYLFRGGKAVKTAVKTGTRTRSDVQIIEHVSAGDTVITTNLLRIRPGADVRIINPN